MPTVLGPDSRGAVLEGTSEGLPDTDEPVVAVPVTTPFALAIWGCAAATAESTYG